MFGKKKKQDKIDAMLSEEIVVTSSDIAKALHQNDAKKDVQSTPKPSEPTVSKPPLRQESQDFQEAELDDYVEPLAEEDVVTDTDEFMEQEAIEVDADVSLDESEDEEEPEEEPEYEEEPQPIAPSQVEAKPQEAAVSPYIWANTEEYEEKMAKLAKKKGRKKRKNDDVETTDEVEEKPKFSGFFRKEEEPEEDKIDLNTFFEASRNKSRRLKRKERKQMSKKERKRAKKRKSRRSRTAEDIKDQKIFKFRKKKYQKVEDFISYLNDHYLDIDEVAQAVLDDENFFGWVSKKSGMFEQSLADFKSIKEKIENNS